MLISVDDVLRFRFMALCFGQVYMNVLNYRVSVSAGVEEMTAMPLLVDEVAQEVGVALIANLPEEWELKRVTGQKVSPTLGLLWETTSAVDYGDFVGALGAFEGDPTSSACLVRKSFTVGRSGIGRTMYGPLDARFIDQGRLVVDPTGDGDLRDVASALTAEQTASSITLRPCIVGAAPGSVTSLVDVRSQTWSGVIASMDTRKIGRGA